MIFNNEPKTCDGDLKASSTNVAEKNCISACRKLNLDHIFYHV
jgi:hypothetical protein